ncbi:hypothetical protein SASPL_130707 [Salvia splendens]|uniref:Uncharacterized protein n=1 Tax=Salvia splendens TaxID=180675 RepID=A0A8X8X6J4_SALSN|nr:hypothetical protein SASPL_130707 [Salvia splendens]
MRLRTRTDIAPGGDMAWPSLVADSSRSMDSEYDAHHPCSHHNDLKQPAEEDLLDGIEEDSDLCTSIHDLDSFMKIFEEEITTSPTSSHGSGAAEERIVESASDCGESGEVEEGIVELVSDSGESRPDLGYLLGGVGRRARDSTSGGVSGEEGAGDGVRRSVAVI